MAIRAKISYKTRSGKVDFRALGPNQALVIGSSTVSDLQLPSDDEVLARHCRIRLSSETCTIEDLTQGKGRLVADGKAFDRLDVHGRQTIKIGHSEIEVEVSGAKREKPNTGEIADSADVKTNPVIDTGGADSRPVNPDLPEYQHDLILGVLHCFEFADDEDGMESLSSRLKGKGCFEFVNFEAIGETAEQHGETDLLAELLEDDEDDSFTVRGPFPYENFPSALIDSRQHDNFMLAITKDPDAPERDEFIQNIKLYMAWLLRPSRFFFSMKNGQKQLIKAIFEQIYAVLFFSMERRTWMLLSMDESVVSGD